MYSEQMETLIEAALQDGVLTNQNKVVLLRRAEKEGIDIDEFEMYTQLQLKKRCMAIAEEEAKRARENKEGKSTECPHCGQSVSGSVDQCPYCDKPITLEATKELTSIIENLEDALVNLKDYKDFERNKAQIERYTRKARMYYSHNPKIKPLLEEINTEMKKAERKYKIQHLWIREHPYIATFIGITLLLVIAALIWGFCVDFDDDEVWWLPLMLDMFPGMFIYGHYNDKSDT